MKREERLSDQVVDCVAGDGDFGKGSGRQGILEENFAIHVRGIGLGAGGVGGIDQDPDLFPDQGGGALLGNFLLGGHGFAIAGFFDIS